MNQITTRYVTENGACYEQYVITDAEAKTDLVIRVASGEQTKAEKHGFREISIFKDGVVL